jgi:hypothetical protein
MTQTKVLNDILETQKKIEKETKKILTNVNKILIEILKEEKEIKKEEQIIKDEEEIIKDEEVKIHAKEEEIKYLIKSSVASRKYNDIIDWKKFIWDNCKYKESKEEDDKITFFCKKLNKTCNFSSCPLNFS